MAITLATADAAGATLSDNTCRMYQDRLRAHVLALDGAQPRRVFLAHLLARVASASGECHNVAHHCSTDQSPDDPDDECADDEDWDDEDWDDDEDDEDEDDDEDDDEDGI